MCGIYGWIQFHAKTGIESSALKLEQMNATLTHRGPDNRGAVVFDDGVLGMTRLAIIDIGGGLQPIANETEDCWIVFNGEIYNFADLRAELEAKGRRFRTLSDTEVILRAYEEWDTDCVDRLRGMFAFAIYDRRGLRHHRGMPPQPGSRLLMARDRLGKKPLYYYQDDNHLIFASEIKAILAHPAVHAQVNPRVMPLYLTYGYVPGPSTFFEDICELPPGHRLTIAAGDIAVERYWKIPRHAESRSEVSEKRLVEELHGHLEESVRIRLQSDAPLGALLSGGIDSAAIVATMSKLTDQPIRTFAIGFAEDPSFNELEYARLIADTYHTDHHEFLVKPDAIELLPQLVWHYDQPFADSSAIPTYLIAQCAREHVKVVLTGDGGDELFAGYERFSAARLAELYRHVPSLARSAAGALIDLLPESTTYHSVVRRIRRFIQSAPKGLAERYLEWVGIFDQALVGELLADTYDLDPVNHFHAYFNSQGGADPIAQLLTVNLMTYLPGDLLVKTDRMTMANSLEARCPFLDQELLEFAWRIPANLKLKGLTTKYILKRAVEGLVPEKIIRRRKHGFGVPVGRWFRTGLRDYLREVLLSPDASCREYFRQAVLHRLIEEHLSGRRDHGQRLWTLLTFEIWHRIFIDGEVSSWAPTSTQTKSGSYVSLAV
jgi:asparagine synthase (glutamine-hydrolysing)